MLMENTADHIRSWNRLVDAGTGRGLTLAPGARADVRIWVEHVDGDGNVTVSLEEPAADFTDPHLAAVKQSKKSAPEPAADTETKE